MISPAVIIFQSKHMTKAVLNLLRSLTLEALGTLGSQQKGDAELA